GQGSCIPELALVDDVPVQRQLNTACTRCSYVGKDRAVQKGWNRCVVVADNVFTLAQECIKCSAESIRKQSKVQPQIVRLLLFPTKVRVGVVCRAIDLDPISVIVLPASVSCVACQRRVSWKSGSSINSVRETQLQVIDE